MCESSGSLFLRTNTGIQSGPEAFDESRFVMTFLIIFGVMEILCSFRLLLEEKIGKERYPSHQDQSHQKSFQGTNLFYQMHEVTPQGRLIVEVQQIYFVENTISNLPKVPSAKFLGSDGLFCFSSICKFGFFKNPFAKITSLCELYFRFRRFILLVQTKSDFCELW